MQLDNSRMRLWRCGDYPCERSKGQSRTLHLETELVGQDEILRALIKALTSSRSFFVSSSSVGPLRNAARSAGSSYPHSEIRQSVSLVISSSDSILQFFSSSVNSSNPPTPPISSIAFVPTVSTQAISSSHIHVKRITKRCASCVPHLARLVAKVPVLT